MHAQEKDEKGDWSPELMRSGEAVSRLPHEDPPKDLVARTLARISASYKPVKRVFWMLRPITHPLARVAAAAVIMMAFLPMLDINLADPLGKGIESRIIGRRTAERIEGFLDRVLLREGQSFSQEDLDAALEVSRPINSVRRVSYTSSRRNGA